jgi:glycosyltransferase involved in cell wall biosynthesis
VPRKNIEEAILLTYFIRRLTGGNYILMVPGKIDKFDPLSEDYYQALKKIGRLAKFRVIFNRNLHLGPFPLKRKYGGKGKGKIKRFSVADIYQVAEAIMMTSLREGFGYPFLECWFVQRAVIGRRIERVIGDFEKSGLNFNWLYDSFPLGENRGNNLNNSKNRQPFERAEKVIRILENKQLEKRILDLNKKAIMKQVDILENKKQREQIIRDNLKTARKNYGISVITKRFLELVGL